MSAPRPGALPSIFSLEPGTDRHDRRGRLRERSDMASTVPVRSRSCRNPPRRPSTRSTSWPTECSSGSSPAARRASRTPGVVVDDDGLTVVDTLMVRSQWEPFAAAVAELGHRVRRVVLTHAHIDHVGGHQGVPASRPSTGRR